MEYRFHMSEYAKVEVLPSNSSSKGRRQSAAGKDTGKKEDF